MGFGRAARHKTQMSPLFYQRDDVCEVARALLGKALFTRNSGGVVTGGLITETEAYAGVVDRASHAYGGRRTARTEVMYRAGGVAYVYLCYGIHCLLNAVTNVQGVPHAVLIRALEPTRGIELMRKRRKNRAIAPGPGALCEALGIRLRHNGASLQGTALWIEDVGTVVSPSSVLATPRIGVAYAGEDAKLPYRFVWQYE